MKKMTRQNLVNAFGGESQAHMRYLHFAVRADQDGFANVARLFRAIAHAEYIHAGDHYRELRHLEEGIVANSMAAFGPGDTSKNLEWLRFLRRHPNCDRHQPRRRVHWLEHWHTRLHRPGRASPAVCSSAPWAPRC